MKYSVICKVYTGFHGTSEIEHGLCACTVDYPLAKARDLSLRTGAQTKVYISHNIHLLVANFFSLYFPYFTGEVWLNEKLCTVSLYDTAGQQDYEAVMAFTYHQSDVIVICFSMADRESFQNVQDVWVPEIRRYLGNKKQIILLGTQSDYAKEASPEQRIHTDEGTR